MNAIWKYLLVSLSDRLFVIPFWGTILFLILGCDLKEYHYRIVYNYNMLAGTIIYSNIYF
jgi:hypothetical protein